MPRKKRSYIFAPYYHVMVQGINKEYVFNEDYFKSFYLKKIIKYTELYGINLIAYCIMGNHAHMLLKINNINEMILAMHNINTSFAIFYNKTLSRIGFVFRDRYKAEPILDNYYLYNCIKYIHMNPVKAFICDNPEDYLFSSFKEYKNETWFNDDELFNSIFPTTFDYNNFLHSHFQSNIYFADEKMSVNEAKKWLNTYLSKEASICIEDINNKKELYKDIVHILKDFCGLNILEISQTIDISRYKIKSILAENSIRNVYNIVENK